MWIQPDDSHFEFVAAEILAGTVIPFLGAGVNLVDRSDDDAWAPPALPSGRDLATYLAGEGKFDPEEAPELVRASQYLSTRGGPGKLYRALRKVFVADYEPNRVHRFLARLPRLLEAEGSPQLLTITTNYDDSLEAAFDAEGVAYDLVYYEAKRRDQNLGKLYHRAVGETEFRLIEKPNEYKALDPDARPVILKIHGAVNRADAKRDSFVITEDDYIEYFSRSEVSKLAVLTERLMDSHCLFLGYSLQDWNLRVLLNQIWGARPLPDRSWAVQKPDAQRTPISIEIETKIWDDRGDVALIFESLAEYVDRLGTFLPDPAKSEQVA